MRFSRLSQGFGFFSAASLSAGLLLSMQACRAAIGLDELSFGPSEGAGGIGGSGGASVSSSSSASSSSGGTGGTMNAGPVCGNGILETTEACDDGNTQNGDDCASDCRCAIPEIAIDKGIVFGSADAQSCYTLFSGIRSFAEAQDLCKSHGMYLASVRSPGELEWIHTFIEPFERIWVGAQRTDPMVNEWVWTSGEPWLIKPCDLQKYPLCDNAINLWSPGEPSNSTGDEDCVELYNGTALGLNDMACTGARVYLCEKPL